MLRPHYIGVGQVADRHTGIPAKDAVINLTMARDIDSKIYIKRHVKISLTSPPIYAEKLVNLQYSNKMYSFAK